jgi:hypothetical protein
VPHSREQLKWKLDASHPLPMGFTLVGGFQAEEVERSVPPVRQVSFREETDEQTWRIGLRRTLGETLNGSLTFSSSDRDGSDYLEANSNAAPDVLGARHLKDRQRDAWKLQLDWLPLEPLSLQFAYQVTDDDYSGRTHGPQSGGTTLLSLDAAYRVNDEWTVTAWAMRDESEIDQSTNGSNDDNSITNTDWLAGLAHKGNSFGFGVRGLVDYQHRVGADLQYGKDTSKHGITIPGSGDASLADIEYKYLRLALFGEYVLDETSGIRVDYIYEKHQLDDWGYNGWVYADGTTVTLEDDEDVHFLGLSYFKKWH